jgi:hypothetical protein
LKDDLHYAVTNEQQALEENPNDINSQNEQEHWEEDTTDEEVLLHGILDDILCHHKSEVRHFWSADDSIQGYLSDHTFHSVSKMINTLPTLFQVETVTKEMGDLIEVDTTHIPLAQEPVWIHQTQFIVDDSKGIVSVDGTLD